MIERQAETKENVADLIRWMQAPPNNKPTLSWDPGPYLERLQRAAKWLNEYMSVRKVWPMMLEHFKRLGKYSEATARRDVEEAQRLFAPLNAHQVNFWTSLMLDVLGEQLKAACLAQKQTDIARLSKEIREWMLLDIQQSQDEKEHQFDKTPVYMLVDPTVAGIEPDPLAPQKLLNWIDNRKKRKLDAQGTATDAEFTEDGPPADPER